MTEISKYERLARFFEEACGGGPNCNCDLRRSAEVMRETELMVNDIRRIISQYRVLVEACQAAGHGLGPAHLVPHLECPICLALTRHDPAAPTH